MKIIFQDNRCEFENDFEGESMKNLNSTQIGTILDLFATDLCSLSCYGDNIGTVKNFLQILQKACSLQRFESDGSVNLDCRKIINDFYSQNISLHLQDATKQRIRLFGFCAQDPSVFHSCKIGLLGEKIGVSQFQEAQKILSVQIGGLIDDINSDPELSKRSQKFFYDFERDTSSSPAGSFVDRVVAGRDGGK